MAVISNIEQPSLILRPNPNHGTGKVEEFTGNADQYKHEIRDMGGFWMASWVMPLDPSRGLDEGYLRKWFDTRLFHVLEERVGGGISWEGVVWEMDLTLDGWKERRSMETLFNRVKAIYTDSSDDQSKETSWYANQASINEYGTRELILVLNDVYTTEAQTRAQRVLRESAEPWPRPVSISRRGRDGLEVTAVGFVWTASNKYVTTGDESQADTAAYAKEITNTDCAYLTYTGQETSGITTVKRTKTPIRAWDKIVDLAEIGNSTFQPIYAGVYADRRLTFEIASNKPVAEWRGRGGGVQTRMGSKNPWLLKPGIIRNLTKRRSTPAPDQFRADGRDSWVSIVRMSEGREEPHLVPEDFDEDELLQAQEDHLRWLQKIDANPWLIKQEEERLIGR